MMLSNEALGRARRFVETYGRPLERARLRYHLDGAPAAEVVSEVARFQNEDGGFGKGLEPDCRIPESSALCTSIAFQVLRETGVHEPDEIAVAAIRYLERALDLEQWTWRIVPPRAQSAPQAPWWNEEARPERPRAFVLNPTAELLGYLYTYREHVSQDILLGLTERVLAAGEGAESMVMHDWLCCKRLAETERLDAAVRDRLWPPLLRLLDKIVCRDPARWAQYTLRPLQAAEGPDSPFYAALQDIIPQNLDYEIASQQPDGSWAPHWYWGDLYPEAWERARPEWAGVLVVEKLLALKRYGRIQGVAP